MSRGTVEAKYEGRTYTIPEIWLVGATTGPYALTIQQAIAQWAWQTELAEREEAHELAT